jgi:hypothetical protein
LLQVLIWRGYIVVFIAGMLVMFLSMLFSLACNPHQAPGAAPPFAFFGIFGVVWLSGICGWVVITILGIIYATKANSGEWAKYPLMGDFVLNRILVNQQFS